MPSFAQRLAITTWLYGTRVVDDMPTRSAANVHLDTDTNMSGHMNPGPGPDTGKDVGGRTDVGADIQDAAEADIDANSAAQVNADAVVDAGNDAGLDVCRMFSAMEHSVLPPRMGGTQFAVTAWTCDGASWPAADVADDTAISASAADTSTNATARAALQTDADGIARPAPTPLADDPGSNGKTTSDGGDGALIFVSVASYRDRDLRNTLHSMFACAANPERLRVGVCAQYKDAPRTSTGKQRQNPPSTSIGERHRLDMADDAGAGAGSAAALALPAAWASRVRVMHVDASVAKGPCFARALIQQRLWAGEPFVLQVDAHMRFVQHWDDALLKELALCETHVAQAESNNGDRGCDDESGDVDVGGTGGGGVVLTTYPPPFPAFERTPCEAGRAQRPTLLCATDFRKGMPRQTGRVLALPSQSPSSPGRSDGLPPIDSLFGQHGSVLAAAH